MGTVVIVIEIVLVYVLFAAWTAATIRYTEPRKYDELRKAVLGALFPLTWLRLLILLLLGKAHFTRERP